MLKLYNTLTRKKEIFKPLKKDQIKIFVCGPTVYDFSHLGHARTYIVYDMLVKFLKSKGYKVFYLQNITDIDDKIIARAKKEKKNWKDIARFFEKEYLKDIKELKINSVKKYARATDHIKEIQNQAKRLLKKGYAYQIDDGIYYDIKKFEDYGKLSERTAKQAEDATSRIDESREKRNRGDFCLWKFSKPGEPKWQSPWGWGRPGWHIEDTAIAEKFFGFQYDIHGGARELIFPHHEAEIAQMEAISGKSPMVRFWVHTGLLKIRGKKMAKSLGNFITIKDFLKKNPPEILKFIVFSSHYRSPLDYSDALAKQARTNLAKLEEFLGKIRCAKPEIKHCLKPGIKHINEFEEKFFKDLEDDFNTPKAKGLLFDFISKINKKIDREKISQKEAKRIYNFFKEINQIFGFLDFGKIEKKEILPKEIKKLVAERENLRSQKKWQEADKIRKEIEKQGFKIEDTEEGAKIKKIESRK